MQQEIAQTVSAVAEPVVAYGKPAIVPTVAPALVPAPETPTPQPAPPTLPAQLPAQSPPPTQPPAPQPPRTINQTDIDSAWAACKQQFASDIQLQVIANNVTLTLLTANELQCVLQAESQKTIFEQKIQPAIIRFFRETVGVTFSLHISVPEVVVEKKIYGAHESFDYLVQKNPVVESLREKLGLEL